MGDGDGWVRCAGGHQHWGRFGAAGLLLIDRSRALLQLRAHWTHEGDTWGLPGGARDSDEDPVATALREANEEAAIDPAMVEPLGLSLADHGGWSYTTVVAAPRGPVRAVAANSESVEARWWPIGAVAELPLHPGLAAAWPALRSPPAPLRLIIDVANVVGSRPDGWWRDRPGAARRLRAALTRLARDGIAASALPWQAPTSGSAALPWQAPTSGSAALPPQAPTSRPAALPRQAPTDGLAALPPRAPAGGLAVVLPQLILVVEGAARVLAGERADGSDATSPRWWTAAMRTCAATGSGDDELVAQARAAARERVTPVLVSADRALRDRVPEVTAVGPGWLWRLLDSDR
ncbi:MAG: NUDIX domain-containing protein [Actinomycetia bacterium]|nr:NUDIX domain-containing protein [Actinomycetes bacterium]